MLLIPWVAASAPIPATSWSPSHLRECIVPFEAITRRRRAKIDVDELVEALTSWRAEHDGLYGMTEPPPEGVRLVADFEPMTTLHLALPDFPDHADTYVPLVAQASLRGRVRAAVVGGVDVRHLVVALAKEGADLSRIELVVEEPAESIWMRDYGPVPVDTPAGLGVLDFAYAPDCLVNDAHPTSSRDGAQPVWRSPLIVDGGNLVTDGRGTCFTTEDLEVEGIPREVIGRHLERWAGCTQLVWLESLEGSGAPHADMFLTPAPGKTLLLASFEPEEDPVNHAIMLRNRRKLQQLGQWRLVDLPVPPPAGEHLVRTWNNSLPFNDALFVPDYEGVPTERLVHAWNELAGAFPGRELIAIPSDVLIENGGAVHCIARGEP